MNYLEKMMKDIEKGVKEGISTIRKKAETLTEEGKRKYKIFDLKGKVHRLATELGTQVYALRSAAKNPLQDSKVKAIIGKIKKLEQQILKLEGSVIKKVSRGKTSAKKKTSSRKKTSGKKTAAKA